MNLETIRNENIQGYIRNPRNCVMQASSTTYVNNFKKNLYVSRNLCVHYVITQKIGVSLIYCNLDVKDESCKMLKWRK